MTRSKMCVKSFGLTEDLSRSYIICHIGGRFSPDRLMTALSKASTWSPSFRFLTLSHLTFSCPSDELFLPSPAHAQSCVSGGQTAGIGCQHSKSNTMGKENLCPKALAENLNGRISHKSFSLAWIRAGRDAWCFP